MFLHACRTSLENTVGKVEFLLFPQCFLPFRRTFRYFHQILNCQLQLLSFSKSLKFVNWEKLNSLPKDILVNINWSNFKAFAEDSSGVTTKVEFLFKRIESTDEKTEIAGCQGGLIQ